MPTDCSSVITSTAACAAALQRFIEVPAMLHEPIQHEDQRERRLVLPLERDRRHPLDGCMPIAGLGARLPFAEDRFPAGDEEPAAVLDPCRERRHRAGRNGRAGDVAEDQDVVRIAAGRSGGQR